MGSYGVAVPVDVDVDFMFQRHIAHIKPIKDCLLVDFLALALNAPQTKQRADQVARGVAQLTVTLGDLARFPIPVPPLDEQTAVVQRANEALAHVQRLLARCHDGVTGVSALESAALAKAFRGELVPQDPNDEPAEKLLERIRAARAAEPEKPRRGRAKGQPIGTEQKPAVGQPSAATAGAAARAIELVVAAFQNGETRLRAADIASATGLDRTIVKGALATLVAGGQLRVEGKARATTYVWTA